MNNRLMMTISSDIVGRSQQRLSLTVMLEYRLTPLKVGICCCCRCHRCCHCHCCRHCCFCCCCCYCCRFTLFSHPPSICALLSGPKYNCHSHPSTWTLSVAATLNSKISLGIAAEENCLSDSWSVLLITFLLLLFST